MGDAFFIVEKGIVSVQKEGEGGAAPTHLIDLKGGDYFGEIALLENSARKASILAKGKGVLV